MPKIKTRPAASDANLALEARNRTQRLVDKHLDLEQEQVNLDSSLRPENPYTVAFRNVAPWSKTPKK